MPLVLNEEQLMFRDAVKRFAAQRAPVAELRRLRDSNDATGFDRSVWKEMAEMGWAGVLVPEAYGGTAFGFVGAGLIAQEIGRNLSVTPFLSTAVMSTTALLRSGAERHKASLLPEVASGEQILAVAFDEHSRHAPFHVATSATRHGDRYALNGRKINVLDAHVADQLIVSARISGPAQDRDGIALFLVDPRTAGVTIERVSVIDSHNATVVKFHDASVAADCLLTAAGAHSLDDSLDAGRAILAAELLGIAEEAFKRTLNYLHERDQFGVKIGTFQALQHRAAHLFCEIELLRSTVLRALQALDAQEEGAARFVSLSKAKACEVARLATNEAVQMHGGIGMTDEFDIGFFMKRARAAAETFGDHYYHADRFAQHAGY